MSEKPKEVPSPFPEAEDAEKGALASLLLDATLVRAKMAERGISSEHFNRPAHRIVFNLFCEMVDAGEPLDFLLITTKLRDRNQLDSIGGPVFLNELSGLLPSSAYVVNFLDVLADKHLRRQAMRKCMEMLPRLQRDGKDATELVAELHGAFTAILHRKSKRPSLKAVLQEIVDEVKDGRDDSGLVHLGMDTIDGRLNLYRGDLLIISAPTSCGKSALAFQMAFEAAMRGHRVALYPLEMKQKATLRRAIAQLGGDNPEYLRTLVKRGKATGQASEETNRLLNQFMGTARTIMGLPVHLRDDLHSFEQIRADIRAEHALRPFTFIVIDYLQLIQSDAPFERKQLMIAHFTQGLKILAGQLDCIICVPSQVNKDGGTREAQDAENDASSLIKIHADEESKDVQPGRVEVWKQREGARHIDLPLKFNSMFTRFDRCDTPTEPKPHPNARRR